LSVGDVLFADVERFGIVVAPVPVLLSIVELIPAAAPEFGGVGAKAVDGDLVVLAIANEPVIGIHAVVVRGKQLDHIVNRTRILRGQADTIGLRSALRIPWRLADSGLADHDAALVDIKVGAGMDPARESLVNQPLPFFRHQIDDEIPFRPHIAVPHEELPEDDAVVLGRRTVGQE